MPGTGSCDIEEIFLPSYSKNQQTLCNQYACALGAFLAGDFTQTVDILETLCRQQPESSQVTSCSMLLKRAREQLEKGPFSSYQATWTGVLEVAEK